MDNLRLFIYLAICCCCAHAKIRINDLIIPAQLEHGQTDYVILDCKFQVENTKDTVGLVVKWFFQKKILVYQWFPGRAPQANEAWSNRIDLNYSVSNDPNTKFRALKITNITTDITGEYMCQVSCFDNEASSARTMVIYEPPKSFVFDHIHNASTLLCSASDTFPKPVMKIYSLGLNSTDLVRYDDVEDNGIASDEDDLDDVEISYGFYNVTTSFHYDPAKIAEPVDFVCELSIPNTSFSRRLKRTIRPEGDTPSTTEQYNYETTTAIQSLVVTDNSASIRTWNTLLFQAAVLLFLLQ